MKDYSNNVWYYVAGIACGALATLAGAFTFWQAMQLVTLGNVFTVLVIIALVIIVISEAYLVVFLATHRRAFDTTLRKVGFTLILVANVVLIVGGIFILAHAPSRLSVFDWVIAFAIVVGIAVTSLGVGVLISAVTETVAIKRSKVGSKKHH